MYDLVILGGGPAGYLAAERSGAAGLKTMVIEKRFIGGVCLNEGCIPSKTLLHSAKIFDYARFSKGYGVVTENAVLDHAAVVQRKNKVVKTLTSGVRSKLKANRVEIIDGEGRISGRQDEGFAVDAAGEVVTARKLLIATGSMPAVPPIPGLEQALAAGTAVTNREILDWEDIPEKLVVIGGGVIGMEMASYFNSAGSDVVVIEMLDHVGGNIDLDLAGGLLKAYKKKGIQFQLQSKVTAIEGNQVRVQAAGKEYTVACDKILLSIGRRPVVEGIGLESIGVEVERGAVVTDKHGRTNIPGVYAAGDVNGRSMLAHTAYREAEVCVNHMLGKNDHVRYDTVPSVIYTNPEVAVIGETEVTATEKGIPVEVVNISARYSGRYVAENEGGAGFIKLVVDKRYQTLIGAHFIGSYASEIIYGVGVMMENEMRVEDIKELVFPHPTVSEVVREAIFELKGEDANA